MGLKRFIKNIISLYKYDLSKLEQEFQNVYYAINHVPFEIEGDLEKIHKYQVKNKLQTLEYLVENNVSISRFGDGELHLMLGIPIPCQRTDEKLSARLKEILSTQHEKLLVGIPQLCVSYLGHDINLIKSDRATYGRLLPEMYKYLNPQNTYYSADISFEYIQKGMNVGKDYYEKYYSMFRSLWDKKDIVIVCGDRVFDYFEYNIYDNAKSVEYIYAKTNDAFEDYDKIIEKIKQHDKNKPIILMLGPTATVLAYDLSNAGYRALDLGHIAKDYDAYKKGLEINIENIGKFFAKE